MILTRMVRVQLAVFTVLSLVALAFVGVVYGRLPARVGIGHYDISADFADASGLYPQANVTYRGVTVGRVTALDLSPDGVRVRMQLEDDARVPRDVSVQLHSTSAIGEQYIDLVPSDDQGPYLGDGAVVPRAQTVEMPQITPLLGRLDRLLDSVPTGATRRVLDQVDAGLGGSADDVTRLVDASGTFLDAAAQRIEQTRSLIAAAEPALATQQALAGNTRAYARALASFTRELAARNGDLSALLTTGASSVDSLDGALRGVQPTLPVLLANLSTTTKALDDYSVNLRQLLVTYPALVAKTQEALWPRRDVGDARLDLRAQFNNPGSCIAGFRPVDQRRAPTDLSPTATGPAYCELAPDAPEGVRGARNSPCPNSSARGPSPASCGLSYGRAVRLGGTEAGGAGFDALVQALDGSFLDAAGLLGSSDDDAPRKGDPWTMLLTHPLGLS